MTQTQKEKLDFRDGLLDAYENTAANLPKNIPPGTPEELQGYLSMNRDIIESMTPDRAISTAIRLSQFSLFITRCINRERSHKTWAERELNLVVSKEIGQFDKFTKHETKVAQVCATNEAAKSLSNILCYAEQRINRLEDIANGLKNLSYVVSLVFKLKTGDRQ